MQQSKSNPFGFLSGNFLKILACICMAIDHVGVVLFPRLKILRIIGRIAFPIFAFMIAEGCKYTKNRLRYFLTIFSLGVIFQIFYYVAEKSLSMCIFITFSLSILIIYALDFLKEKIIEKSSLEQIILATILFITSVIGAFFICENVSVDYGFWGVMVAVFASVFNFREKEDFNHTKLNEINFIPLNVISCAIGLALLSFSAVKIQWYCFLAIPLLILYSGKRGKLNLKYFFYVFYPTHLVVIYGISILLTILK